MLMVTRNGKGLSQRDEFYKTGASFQNFLTLSHRVKGIGLSKNENLQHSLKVNYLLVRAGITPYSPHFLIFIEEIFMGNRKEITILVFTRHALPTICVFSLHIIANLICKLQQVEVSEYYYRL